LQLHYTSFAALLRFIPRKSAPLIAATFSAPATNFSARLHGRSGCVQWALIFSFANALQKNKPAHCPCVAIVWHKLRYKYFIYFATLATWFASAFVPQAPMLHTLAPLAGGSPHNGLQIIHSLGSAIGYRRL
jgi:hypothetical protein